MEGVEKDLTGYLVEEVEPDLRKLDEYVYTLEAYKKNGIKVLFKYGDKILYPGISHQAAWYLCGGMPEEEYAKGKEEKENFEDKIAHRRNYMPDDDLRRIEKAKKVRDEMKKNGKELIDENNIIEGLKFMAENKSLSQDDFDDGLILRGCVFTINDIREKYLEPYSLIKFRNAELSAGAFVLANARDSESSRRMLEDIHFKIDDDDSVYHFIRLRTHDNSYTKELVEKNKKSL